VFAPGELPLVLLALCEEQPLKPYQLIEDLERLLGSGYRPSPGAIYPALQALVAEKLVAARKDGRAKRYECTAAGRRLLEARRATVAQIEERTGARLRAEHDLRPLLDRFTERVMRVSGLADRHAVEHILTQAADAIENLQGETANARF
jgi:DNA-binding PadR family transcriptional regulator